MGKHDRGHVLFKIRAPKVVMGRICRAKESVSVTKVVEAPVVIPIVEKEVEKVVDVVVEEEKEQEVVAKEKEVDSIVTIAPILSESVIVVTPVASSITKKPLSATFLSDVRPFSILSFHH